MAFHGSPVRVLVIPGLRGSGPVHWQSWLQGHFRRAVRVEQDDWDTADLETWATRIGETIAAEPSGPWVAVAHSFGCLALAQYVLSTCGRTAHGVRGALLVAPADPGRFALDDLPLRQRLRVPATLLASDTDPWMSAARAESFAQAWGSGFVNLGDAGHINADAGFGPLPAAKKLTEFLIHRVEQSRRPERADLHEFSFAV
jgi:predicted alpha/beta hydrolase family esterase